MGTSDIDLFRGKQWNKLLFQDVLWPFHWTTLIKKCLCCTGNLVSLHERTSQLLISFLPETKIWLPWSLSACWSNICNHIRNYTANHFLTGSRTSEKMHLVGLANPPALEIPSSNLLCLWYWTIWKLSLKSTQAMIDIVPLHCTNASFVYHLFWFHLSCWNIANNPVMRW